MAYGKACDYLPIPNYKACADNEDSVQLTDDIYTNGSTNLWMQTKAVGWQYASSGVTITVDLGRVEPISGVSFSTASSLVGGVTWPLGIYILVAGEDGVFYEVGDLARLTEGTLPDPESYHIFRYRTEKLATKGRFLRLYILNPGPFTFCDEIEVYRGDSSFINIPYSGNPVSTDELLSRLSQLTNNGCRARFKLDLDKVKTRIQSSLMSQAAKDNALSQANQLAAQIDNSTYPEQLSTFKAIVPYNDLHKQIFKLNAQVLSAKGLAPLVVWHTHPYARLTPFTEPNNEPISLAVTMMPNEYRSEVINLTNSTQNDLTVQIQLLGLPGGSNPAFVKVYQVEHVDSQGLVVVASALTELASINGFYNSVVPAGMTRQIWFSFHPDASITPGNYTGSIYVQSDVQSGSFPLTFSLSTVVFPSKADCVFGMWDYASPYAYGLTSQNREAAFADLKAHWVNAAWATSDNIPYPQPGDLDAQGNLIREPDFSKFDSWVTSWPGARYYIVFANLNSTSSFAGIPRSSDSNSRFYKAIKNWSVAWDAHNQIALRLNPGQLVLHWLDEPKTDNQFQTIKDWATPFRDGTGNLCYVNPLIDMSAAGEVAQAGVSACDFICPTVFCEQTPNYTNIRAYYDGLRSMGKNIWFYSCNGPIRHFDPTSYYRLQPWHCYVQNAVGSMFWAYGDAGNTVSSWNEYTCVGGTSYTPVYLDTTITTAKHWEAAREGIEDYQYLKMLKDKTDALAVQEPNNPLVGEARNFLSTQPRTVVNSIGRLFTDWPEASINHALPDQVRLQTLDLIEQVGN